MNIDNKKFLDKLHFYTAIPKDLNSKKKNDFPISEKASEEVLSIPMNAFLSDDQVNYIVSKLKKII